MGTITAGAASGPPAPAGRAGLRSTRQRAAVLESLRECDGFVSAQDLHARLAAEGHRVGLSTVYRTLQALASVAEIDAIATTEGEARYRACAESLVGAHHHLVCRRCGRTVEVHNASVARWVARVAQDNGFRQARHTLDIIGTCSRCDG